MIKRHIALFYFIGLLISINILHLLVFLILHYNNFFSYNQEGVILLVSFQLIFFLGIFCTTKWLGINLRLKWISCSASVIINVFFLSLFLFVLQMAIDKSFLDSLAQGQLRFLKFNFTVSDDFYGVTAIIISIFFAPILEEVLYRRIIFRKLLESYNLTISIIITSVLFAVMHLSLEGLLAYFFIGLVFTYLYHLTKILWLNVLAHSLYNIMSNFTKIETYHPNDSLYFIGILIYITSAIGIFIALKKIKDLTI